MFSRIEDTRDLAFSPKALLRPWAIPWIEALLVGYLDFCAQFFLSTCIFFGKPVCTPGIRRLRAD